MSGGLPAGWSVATGDHGEHATFKPQPPKPQLPRKVVGYTESHTCLVSSFDAADLLRGQVASAENRRRLAEARAQADEAVLVEFWKSEADKGFPVSAAEQDRMRKLMALSGSVGVTCHDPVYGAKVDPAEAVIQPRELAPGEKLVEGELPPGLTSTPIEAPAPAAAPPPPMPTQVRESRAQRRARARAQGAQS